ncbi:Uncharacterised protein [Vibrio cholerae]|nr:Uncharacterised protein [Vibrio cholerae]
MPTKPHPKPKITEPEIKRRSILVLLAKQNTSALTGLALGLMRKK